MFIPQTIARYQIKEQLGVGGFGIVYRAYDPILQRDVALKLIWVQFLSSPTFSW